MPRRPCLDDDLYILWEESQHPLLPKSVGEHLHGGGMNVSLVRALSWRPVGKEDYWPDHFIAPWRLIDNLELSLREIFGWHPHGSLLPASEREMYSTAGGWCHGPRWTFVASRRNSPLV